MKRFILLLSICWIGFVGCSSNSAEKEPEPVIPTIDLGANTGGITLPEEQGVTAQLTFTTNVEWSITTSDTRAVPTWFDVTPKSGQAGTHTVTVSVVEPNELYDDRSGFIEINYGTEQHRVMVTQKRKEAILLTQAKYEVPMAGGTVSVEVKSNLDYTTTIKQPEWIHQTGTRGLTATTLNFTVDASEESVQREGQIVFQAGDLNETVHIYQAGGDILVLTQKEYTVSAAGETITVELKSNADYTVDLPAVDWIKESSTRAISSHTRYFAIAANEGYENRTAQLVFKTKNLSETVTITQLQQDAIVAAKDAYEVAPEGGMLDFEVAANVAVEVAVAEDAQSWIKRITTRAMEQTALHFEIAPNNTETDRTGTITLSGGSSSQMITVSQAHLPTEEDHLREVLIKFYQDTGGDQWKGNNNWCSTEPIGTWHGILMDHEQGTIQIRLTDNNLTGTVDLSDCTAICSLNVYRNNLTAIDVSNCSALDFLSAMDNPLTGITVDGCHALQHFSVGKGDQLSQIDLSGCSVFDLDIAESPVNRITFPKNGSLAIATCWGLTNLEQLDLSGQTALKTIECSSNSKLTHLFVDGCTALESIECIGNSKLAHLSVDGCTALESIDCSSNPCLKGLDTRGCNALRSIITENNQMESLIASGCQSLQTVRLSGEGSVLESLDLSNCPSLTDIYTSAQLYEANLSGCTSLSWFKCHFGGLKRLDVSNCVSLWSLECEYNNDLVYLNVAGCRNLQNLFCEQDQLSELDLSTCPALTHLHCEANSLTALDVTNCPNLQTLSCGENYLSSLKLGSLPKLQILWCSTNELTDIDLSGCTALESLHCRNNPITRVITDYYANLPVFEYDKRYEYIYSGWEEPVWRYTYEDHHGWYYPDEPYAGHIYGGN